MNNNIAFNVKVVPGGRDTREAIVDRMFAYVKSYFDLGGMQMQLNVVTSETLRDAMAHPENYRNLLVRISGYNAYFVTLNRDFNWSSSRGRSMGCRSRPRQQRGVPGGMAPARDTDQLDEHEEEITMTTAIEDDRSPARDAGQTFDAEVCLIGAGASGLAAGKALADRGIAFDWFEKGSMVGGLWRIDNDNGGAAAYKTLHLNSSRPLTQYPSYPMPEDWPDYPHHEMIASYFQSFAEDNHLIERITFRTEVTSVEPLSGEGDPGAQGWAVTVAGGQRRTYRAVMVANGHHGSVNIPDFPGEFTGQTFHAHEYRDPAVFADKDVVVVGVGNSGMDIACDAAKVARRVYLVTRHGVHVIPKYAFGGPVDQLGNPLMGYIPFPVERTLYETIMRLSTGRPEDRGLPKPDHRLLHAHPTVSAELYDRVGHGDITMKPGIEALEGRPDPVRRRQCRARRHAGVRDRVPGEAAVPGARGLRPRAQRDAALPAGRVPRPARAVLHRVHPDGRCQHPLYEYQSQWIGDVLTGDAVLPSPDAMRAWIAKDQKSMGRRYLRLRPAHDAGRLLA